MSINWKVDGKKLKFDCGCQFDVREQSPDQTILPFIEPFDLNKLPDCKRVWDMIKEGKVKGVFQLESGLGRTWAMRVAPDKMDHLAALGAVLRPGCLQSYCENGISMTEHYALRKNGAELVDLVNPVYDEILKDTYGILVYQEQAIRIAVELAGFTPSEADSLRKAMGKKDTAEMAKVQKKFIEGIKRVGIVSEELGNKIFDNIKSSQRYAFNLSHSMSYGLIGYQTAYVKAHFPLQFFTSWIAWSKEKQEAEQEINDLIMEAKLFDIDVWPPQIQDFQYDTYNDHQKVFLGLTEIKGIGVKAVDKIKTAILENNVVLDNLNMDQIIVESQLFCGESVMEKLINAGAFSKWSKDRKRNVDKVNKFNQLSGGEQKWCLDYSKENRSLTMEEILTNCAKKKKEGGGCHNDKRVSFVNDLVNLMKNPSSPLDDTQFSIYNSEHHAFGVALTVSKVDTVNTIDVSQTCKNFIEDWGKHFILAVEISDFRVMKTKKGRSPGKEMAYLSVTDGTAKLDNVTVFPEKYAIYKDLIEKGSIIVLKGYKDNKNGQISFITQEIFKGEK